MQGSKAALARTGARNPDVPGVGAGGEQLLAPRHRTVPPPAALAGKGAPTGACATPLGHAHGSSWGRAAGMGWDMGGLMGFVSSPQGGIVGGNRLGTGKISDWSMNQRGRNKTSCCQIFLVSLSCQMNPSHVKCKIKMCPPMTVL